MIIKSTVTTLQKELTAQTVLYSNYLQTIAERKEVQPLYNLHHIIALRALIRENAHIKSLYKAISDYCQHNLAPSFGEKWRLFFGAQKNYDLYANLQGVLRQEKYCPDALTAIEEDYEWRLQTTRELRQQIRQELRQDVLSSPDVIVNEEIVRLNALNAQLEAHIARLQEAFRKAEQKSDYWQGQYQSMKTQRDNLAQENSKYKEENAQKQQRITVLERQNKLNNTKKEQQEQTPTSQSYTRQPT